jgi:outer membrane protein assembly factor BamB
MYVASYPTPAGNKTVYAVSLGSGYIGWGARTSGDVVANLAKGGPLGGDTFYFATTNGAIFAYPTYLASERDPEPAWQVNAAADVRYDLAVDENDLAVVTGDGRLICYDRITGNVRWEAYPTAGEHAQSAAQFSASLVFYRRGGALHAFDRASGVPRWSVKGGERFVAERDGRILVTASGSRLVAVDAKSGEVEGSAHMPHVIFPVQRTPNGTVVAITRSGLMVAVEYGW